jgi:hypothetical protein
VLEEEVTAFFGRVKGARRHEVDAMAGYRNGFGKPTSFINEYRDADGATAESSRNRGAVREPCVTAVSAAHEGGR